MEERGIYITLLCLQHQKGHLTEKMIRLCLGNAAASPAADVMAKFRQDPAGLWYNQRLEEEIEKRKAHGKKQSERALQGWEKRKKQSHGTSRGTQSGNAAALPLEDENENVIEDRSELKNKKEPDFSKPDVDGDEIVFPFNTDPMRQLWAGWKRYRWTAYKARYPMMGEQAALKMLQGMTYQQVEKTILEAISRNWKNLYPEHGNTGDSKTRKPGITAEGSLDRLNSYTD